MLLHLPAGRVMETAPFGMLSCEAAEHAGGADHDLNSIRFFVLFINALRHLHVRMM